MRRVRILCCVLLLFSFVVRVHAEELKREFGKYSLTFSVLGKSPAEVALTKLEIESFVAEDETLAVIVPRVVHEGSLEYHVVKVQSRAFETSVSRTGVSVFFPNSLTQIEGKAFLSDKGGAKIGTVVLPESLETLGNGAFHGVGVNRLVCLRARPPKAAMPFITGGANETVHEKLIVPTGAEAAYKADAVWGVFASRLEAQAVDVSFPQASYSVKQGATYSLVPTVSPNLVSGSGALPIPVSYLSLNPTIVMVDETGTVTGLAIGEVDVHARLHGSSVSGKCKILVSSGTVAVQSVKIVAVEADGSEVEYGNGKKLKLGLNRQIQLQARVLPVNATNPSVKWASSEKTKVSVSAQGLVHALAVGKSVLTLQSAENPGVQTSCEVEVEPVLVSAINLKKGADIVNGKEVEFHKSADDSDLLGITAAVLPADATDGSIRWESEEPTVATIAKTAGNTVYIKGVGLGSAAITATASDGGKVRASFTVRISDVAVESITIEPKGTVGFDLDGLNVYDIERIFTATVLPAAAASTPVAWSMNPEGIVRLETDMGGASNHIVLARAIAPGVCTLTATAGGKSVSVTLRVKGHGIQSLIPSHEDVKVGIGWAKGRKVSVRAIPDNVPYSVDNIEILDRGIAQCEQIDDNVFYVYGIAEGTTKLRISAKGRTAVCNIHVSPDVEAVEVTSLQLSPAELTIGVGEMHRGRVKVNVLPEEYYYNPAAIGATGVVIADPQIADASVVRNRIRVVGRKVGSTTLSVTVGGHSAYCRVNVVPAEELSVEEEGRLLALRLTPNPTEGYFSLGGVAPGSAVRVYTLKGDLVWTGTVGSGGMVDVRALPRGMYILAVGRASAQFIKI